MRTDSYSSLLGAVGKALDLADARSFAVRESDTGLTLELVDGRGERLSFELSIAEVAELLDWAQPTASAPERVVDGRDEGTLHAFMERHTLVGAR